MINYYQPFLFPFLHTKPYSLRKEIKRYYYFSWEDGLWDLLIQKNISRGAVILIPDFYCMDVVENIKSHGYTPVFYHLDNHVQIDPTTFAQVLEKEKPQVIIIFHPAGITSHMMHDLSWLPYAQNAIIIEDCVHRLVDPQDIRFIASNHVVMDSLRKDSPLPGAFMYGSREFLSYQPKATFLSRYFLLTAYYFITFRIILMTSAVLRMPSLTKYAHEVILKKHDDIVGDSLSSHRGLPFIPFIHRFINFKKVKKLKEKQVVWYKKALSKKTLKHWYQIDIPSSDYQHLHVYPLGIHDVVSTEFIEFLHTKGIIVWNKFPDSPWCQTRSILFLPLGFHITEKIINTIVTVIEEYGL